MQISDLYCKPYLDLPDITCLRDLELILPPAASLGETVVIECNYHLQGEEVNEEQNVYRFVIDEIQLSRA